MTNAKHQKITNRAHCLAHMLLTSLGLFPLHAAFASSQDPEAYVITVSEDPAGRPLGDYLSVTRPKVLARSDAPLLKLHFDPEQLENYASRLKPRRTDYPEYYTELRGFSGLKVVLTAYTWGQNGSLVEAQRETLNLDSGAHAVRLKQVVATFSVSLEGVRRSYKCFTPETCLDTGPVTHRVEQWDRFDAPPLLETHEHVFVRGAGSDNAAFVSMRLDRTGHYRLTLAKGPAAEALGLAYRGRGPGEPAGFVSFDGFGQVASQPGDFVGFAAVLGSYGHPSAPESSQPRHRLHVFPEGAALRLRTERLPYYLCDYSPNYGDGGHLTISMPPGVPCPRLGSYSFVAARGGQDDTEVRDWALPE